jgi:signal transduction histidine kinase
MEVSLQYRDGVLTLKYFDHGTGYQVKNILTRSKGMGLSNMIYRVGLINGSIRFTREGGNTVVYIKTPVLPIEGEPGKHIH